MFKKKLAIGAIALATATITAIAPTAAQASISFSAPTVCNSGAVKIWRAFAAFGDNADYWLAPGGDFESSMRGWTMANSRVVSGNETSGVLKGTRSLALGSGLLSLNSTVVSPPFCVTEEHPTFRYVLKANGAVGALSTFIRYRATDGSTKEEEIHSRTATNLLPGRWKPSDLQPLATKLPLSRFGGSVSAQLVFRSAINVAGAGYQIDNVLIDPYRTR